MILLLTGPDDFSRREALDALKATYDQDGALAANTLSLDAATLAPVELRAAAGTVPFLADHRLVVVRGLGARFEAGGGRRRRRPPDEWEGLPALLQEVPESTLLVFVEDALGGRNPLREAVAAAGEVRDFPLPSQRDLPPWVQGRARAVGLRLNPPAVRALTALVGRNLWALASEIEKLKLYAGDDPVSEEDVRALVADDRDVTIFQLVDAVAEGRLAAAMPALQRLRASESAQRVIAMLARQFRMLVIAREILDRGGMVRDVEERLEVRDFVARRAVDQARRLTQAAADAALPRILECEAAILRYRQGRPGGQREDLALELLVADLAGLARGATRARTTGSR